jgi:hypothetical protein
VKPPLDLELTVVLAFRRVLERTGEGMGVSQSLIRELGGAGPPGADVRRRLLLGLPPGIALLPISSGPMAEASMLASLVLSSRNSSVVATGKKGEALSNLAERWVKARENQKLEARVRRARSLLASAVAGAVSSMIATMGPLLGSLSNIANPAATSSGSLLLPGAVMALISSGLLGLYTSGRGFYLNVMVTGVVYGLVSLAVAPLASFPSSIWAIK